MRRKIALLTAFIMIFSLIAPIGAVQAASSAGETKYDITPQKDLLAKVPKSKPKGSITVGSATQLNSDFFSGWSNTTTNADIKALIHGYSTISLTPDEEFVPNPMVLKSLTSVDNKDGSKTYTLTINSNLVWNDGSRITAKDYVFSILLRSSPQFQSLDGTSTGGINYVGYEDFNTGKSRTFSGIRLIDNFTFSISIKAEQLPFFYDITYADVTPYPMAVIAPNCNISDTGSGATITDNFTNELLRKTMLDPKTGYRYNPKVTSGPYNFVSFDNTTYTAVITTNPKFLGTYDGMKPQIDKIILKYTAQPTQMKELEAGSVDLISGVSGGARINEGLDIVDKNKAEYSNYPRAGYGKIAFHCDFGPTQFEAVRQAVCWLLDREEFARQYSGGYAVVVDSRYGQSQWMYKENKDILEDKLINYTLNVDKAREVLVADGWTLNEKGGAYVEGPGRIRYKKVNGELMPLIINWASSKDNPVSDLLSIMLPPEADKIGMKIEQSIMDSVLDYNQRINVDEPYYHMFNMGTGFGIPDSPWYYYSTDEKFFVGGYNSNFIKDEKLESLTQAMKLTKPTDRDAFAKKWIDFMVRWNEALPDIPLYSDTYHDFFNPKIDNYTPGPNWQWRYAIIYASIK